jgi:hypothetical protein
METTNGLLPRASLLHWLGRLCDGSNHVENKLWVHKVLGSKCSPWPWDIIPTSSHTMHSTFGG